MSFCKVNMENSCYIRNYLNVVSTYYYHCPGHICEVLLSAVNLGYPNVT